MDKIVNPPYVAGPDGARDVKSACVACGCSVEVAGVRVPLTDMAGWVCADFLACTARYRGGMSPETFAAGLRGEILGIDP